MSSNEQDVLENERKNEDRSFQTKKAANEFLTNFSDHFKLCNIVKLCCTFMINILEKIIQKHPTRKDALSKLIQNI